MKAWIVSKTRETRGETIIEETTTVYAENQIDATRQGIALFGNQINVTQIPDEYGGAVPTDQDIAAAWREIIAERGDQNTDDTMRSAGGGAYQ